MFTLVKQGSLEGFQQRCFSAWRKMCVRIHLHAANKPQPWFLAE